MTLKKGESILVLPDETNMKKPSGYAAVVTAGKFDTKKYTVPPKFAEPSIVLITTKEEYDWIKAGKFDAIVKAQMGIHRSFHDKVDIQMCIREGWIQKKGKNKPVHLSPTQCKCIEQKSLVPSSQPLALPKRILYMHNDPKGAIVKLFDEVRKIGEGKSDPKESRMVIKQPELLKILKTGMDIPCVPEHTHDYLSLRNVYMQLLFSSHWVRNRNWNYTLEGNNKWVPIEGVLNPCEVTRMISNLELNHMSHIKLEQYGTKHVPVPKSKESMSTPPVIQTSKSSSSSSSSSMHIDLPIFKREIRVIPRQEKAASAPITSGTHDHDLFAKFKKDIKDPKFVLRLLAAELTFLEGKKERYDGFLKLEWSADFVKVLQENKKRIEDRISLITKPSQEIVDQKTNALKEMLKDLRSIKQKSRLNALNEVIRLVYTFVTFPSFYLSQFMNYTIVGSAGSGKTSLAKVMATTFYTIGVNLTSKVKYATSQDLIAVYLGQTAVKTRTALMEILEGVMFIDEAYGLASCDTDGNLTSEQRYGAEAITELINFIDKFRGCLVVILAGYPHMINNCLMKTNEGLPRRFAKSINLQAFNPDELTKILFIMMKNGTEKEKTELFSKEHIDTIRFLIKVCATQGAFSNGAGDMENLNQVLIEDYVVHGGRDTYTPAMIMDTFRKFLWTKNMDLQDDAESL